MNAPRTAVVLLLALAACQARSVREAAERGSAAAASEIAAGEAHLTVQGLAMPWASPLDPSTGLLVWNGGCEISDESMAYSKAHDDAILAALREGRLAGQTYAEKATSRGALDLRFAKETPVALVFGGPAAVAPEGRWRVEIAPRRHPQAPADETPYLFVTDTTTGTRRELHWIAGGGRETDVLFDHGGTTLLVAWRGVPAYSTFDLPRATVLQQFPPVNE